MKGLDIAGQTFGRLTAIKKVGITRFGKAIWVFQCSCGNDHTAVVSNVINGTTSSCGCLRKELLTVHGRSGTRLNRIYGRMIDRCYNPKNEFYANYGGRGITVCDEWLNSKPKFFEWATRNGYSNELSIDRKNNNKGYFPDNCRWATIQEQANNTSRNILITFKGQTKTVTAWAYEIKMHPNTLLNRIKRGLSPFQALTMPKYYQQRGLINARS